MNRNQFGKLLTQGLKCIAALEKSELTDLQKELGNEIGVSVWTLYKWRKGTSIPNDDRTIALLARACVQRGRMDRQWLSAFLFHTVYTNKQALIDQLCKLEEAPATTPVHNLPRRQHLRLVGRDQELADIKNFLSPRHRVGVVCISGGGGVGKTALALEIAHACFEESAHQPAEVGFDAIIWATAKSVELMAVGQVERQPTFTDLDGIYRAIGDLLDLPVIFRTATRGEKNIIVTHLLAEKRILLMLDNFEEVNDQELMIFLRDLPAPSKAIVTTRHRIDVAVPVHLHSLNHLTAHELVRIECARHRLELSDGQIATLLQRTGGLPLAIIRTISRMAWRGSNVETEIHHLEDPNNLIYDFCFAKTLSLIKFSDAYQVFMALALFTAEADREAIGYVAGFGESGLRRDEALSDLEVLSLCQRQNECFRLEPLTRTQAYAELRMHPNMEAEARVRWTTWYTNVATAYGGRDGQEMHLRYDHLESDWDSVRAAIHWCIDQGQFEQVLTLWNSVRDFTHIYGYWTDRLELLDWMIGEAERRGAWQIHVCVMYDRAFTLTLTGPSTRLEEADMLLQRCWSLRQHTALVVQARVAALRASLELKQGAHSKAHQWLDTAEDLLRAANISVEEQARERTSLLFDRVEAFLSAGELERAQSACEEMLEQGKLSSWQRSIAYAQNWLAYMATLQHNRPLAEHYLHLGWRVANRIKEKRLIAYYKRTFAYFYHEMGDRIEALRWSEDARDTFVRLGMPPDIVEMQLLIKRVKAA